MTGEPKSAEQVAAERFEREQQLLALDPPTLRQAATTARQVGRQLGSQLSRIDLAASRKAAIEGGQQALDLFAIECEGLATWIDRKRAPHVVCVPGGSAS